MFWTALIENPSNYMQLSYTADTFIQVFFGAHGQSLYKVTSGTVSFHLAEFSFCRIPNLAKEGGI